MRLHATIDIDDDRWAKHPYGITLNAEDGTTVYRKSSMNSRAECYRVIERAKSDGYTVDGEIDEYYC